MSATTEHLRSFAMLLLLLAGTLARAATIEVQNGQGFEAAVERLNPGDTLIVHAGTYIDVGPINIVAQGAPAQPIIVQAAAGVRPIITRPTSGPQQNTINIVGATHLTIRGLEIVGGLSGAGVRIGGASSNVTLENLIIRDVDVGIALPENASYITVKRNEIRNTRAPGEGIFVGCHDAGCAVTDSTFQNNWIHNTGGQGEGIEIKNGSYGNIVRDNVIHDTAYPCIVLYGGRPALPGPPNVVEGNAAWNCGSAALQVLADAVVRNNIFFAGTGEGIRSIPVVLPNPTKLEIVNNTLIGGAPCLRFSEWQAGTGMVFANNAVYCQSGNFSIGSMANVTMRGNVFAPQIGAIPSNAGRSLALDFVDSAARNVYPRDGSALLDSGDAILKPTDDFNGFVRLNPTEVGAYQRSCEQNPGWPIAAGFKEVTRPPVGRPCPPQNLQVVDAL